MRLAISLEFQYSSEKLSTLPVRKIFQEECLFSPQLAIFSISFQDFDAAYTVNGKAAGIQYFPCALSDLQINFMAQDRSFLNC